jgi:hypothetical protein
MRPTRLLLIALLAALAFAPAACTNPTGPAPSNNDSTTSKI